MHHGVALDDAALRAAVEWSIRYLPDFRLPDKALDLVDQACAAARFQTLTSQVDEKNCGETPQARPAAGRVSHCGDHGRKIHHPSAHRGRLNCPRSAAGERRPAGGRSFRAPTASTPPPSRTPSFRRPSPRRRPPPFMPAKRICSIDIKECGCSAHIPPLHFSVSAFRISAFISCHPQRHRHHTDAHSRRNDCKRSIARRA